MAAWTEKLLRQSWTGEFRLNEPMTEHTTFRIGGPAAGFLEVGSVEDIQKAILLARENDIPFFVMGNGSNLLVRDEGYAGLILHLGNLFARVTTSGTLLKAQAGALLPAVSQAAAQASLAGLAFASGIPGSLGGAVYMNAGAYGGQMADVVRSVEVLLKDEIRTWDASVLDYGYRHSALMNSGAVVLTVTMALQAGDRAEIVEQMRGFNAARREKQPIQMPSAGSAFKRPEGAYAAALIDQCGLKGMTVGGAQVSEKHAGFVVNAGGATARDVLTLCDRVASIVREKTGFSLEKEFIVL